MLKFTDRVARLPLNTKLILGFGALLLITIPLSLQNILALRSLTVAAGYNYENHLLGIAHIQEANVNLVAMGRGLREMAMTPGADARSVARRALAAAEEAARRELEESRKRLIQQAAKEMFAEFEPLFATYARNVNRAADLLARNDPASDGEAERFILSPEFKGVGAAADRVLGEIVLNKQGLARKAAEEGIAMVDRTRNRTVGLLLFGLTSCLFLGLLAKASILRPLDDLRDSIGKLAQGHLDIRVPHTDYQNEIGLMAQSVHTLQQGAQAREQQHRIEQQLADIGQTVQGVATLQEFADTLTTRLAPMLGLVYGALYVADQEA
ncbi:MAG: MCP four helix bundle domain-containing protein, partial [Planctomycetes bacterium]|nr:MCP four helix bundle domain-containing protein [Planctomycetota bacterium]